MFEKCVSCPRLGRDCMPNLMVMDITQMRSWARAVKKQRGLSNADLAARCGTPKSTIAMQLSDSRSGEDVYYSTFAPILCALIDAPKSERECPPLRTPEDILALHERIEELKQQVAEEHRISERRVRTMYVLSILLLIAMITIIATTVSQYTVI